MTDDLERRFLLVKRGLYYRPNGKGYTGIKEQAGRYLESDALPDSGVTAIHEDDAPDYSAACWDDIAREHLQSKVAEAADEIARLRAENEALREALEPFDDALGEDDPDYEDGCGLQVKWGAHINYSLRLGDFRRARQALQEGSIHE